MKRLENWKSATKKNTFVLPLYFSSGLEKFSALVRGDTCENVDLATSPHANAMDGVFLEWIELF